MNPSNTLLRQRIRLAFFIPKAHDNIETLVTKLYGVYPNDKRLFEALRNYTWQANPELSSPRTPFGLYVPRTLGFISNDPHYFLCTNPALIEKRITVALSSNEFSAIDAARKATPQDATERDIYAFLAKLSAEHGLADKVAGTGIGLLGHMTGTKNQAILQELAMLHTQRYNNQINRRAFVLNKKRLIDAYTKAVGPLANLLHGDNNLQASLHQNRGQGLSPSGQFIKEADRLAKLAKKAKVGGLVLTATGAAMSVAQMCTADTTYEKNVHLVKGTGSFLGGFAGGLAANIVIGTVFVSGPVGWGVALFVSAASAAFAGDQAASALKNLYDRHGREFDLATASGLTRVCL